MTYYEVRPGQDTPATGLLKKIKGLDFGTSLHSLVFAKLLQVCDRSAQVKLNTGATTFNHRNAEIPPGRSNYVKAESIKNSTTVHAIATKFGISAVGK